MTQSSAAFRYAARCSPARGLGKPLSSSPARSGPPAPDGAARFTRADGSSPVPTASHGDGMTRGSYPPSSGPISARGIALRDTLLVSEENQARTRVVVAEDDVLMRAGLAGVLEEGGYEV